VSHRCSFGVSIEKQRAAQKRLMTDLFVVRRRGVEKQEVPKMKWKLVPVEPTEEMLDELGDDGYNTKEVKRRYKSALISAPPVPEELVLKVAQIIDPSGWRVRMNSHEKARVIIAKFGGMK
jgi:hypothetical protein